MDGVMRFEYLDSVFECRLVDPVTARRRDSGNGLGLDTRRIPLFLGYQEPTPAVDRGLELVVGVPGPDPQELFRLLC